MKVDLSSIKFKRINALGLPRYAVVHPSRGELGHVYRRPGGWWGWQQGETGGSWCGSRKEAAEHVVRAAS